MKLELKYTSVTDKNGDLIHTVKVYEVTGFLFKSRKLVGEGTDTRGQYAVLTAMAGNFPQS